MSRIGYVQPLAVAANQTSSARLSQNAYMGTTKLYGVMCVCDFIMYVVPNISWNDVHHLVLETPVSVPTLGSQSEKGCAKILELQLSHSHNFRDSHPKISTCSLCLLESSRKPNPLHSLSLLGKRVLVYQATRHCVLGPLRGEHPSSYFVCFSFPFLFGARYPVGSTIISLTLFRILSFFISTPFNRSCCLYGASCQNFEHCEHNPNRICVHV